MFIVKVHGETLGDLKLGLEAKLAEIEGRSIKTPRTFGASIEGTDDSNDGDEYESVDSPFAHSRSDDQSIPLNTVVDNEKDVEGIPWDSRIHSGGKSKNKDGTWKAKKGVDKAEAAQVKAELLTRGSGAPVMHIGGTPVYVEAPVNPNQSTSPIVPQQHAPASNAGTLQPVVTIPQSAPALPTVQSGHTLQSFQNQFALVMSNLITQGKITQEYVNVLKQHFGVAEVYLFNADQQAACFHEFVKCGIIQQVG